MPGTSALSPSARGRGRQLLPSGSAHRSVDKKKVCFKSSLIKTSKQILNSEWHKLCMTSFFFKQRVIQNETTAVRVSNMETALPFHINNFPYEVEPP